MRWRACSAETRAPFEAQAACAKAEYDQALLSHRKVLDDNFDRIREYEGVHGGEASFTEPPLSPVPSATAATSSSSSSPTSSSSSSSEQAQAQVPCTACDSGTLGKVAQKRQSKKRRVHPLLDVPVCSGCLACYESGEFLVSEDDRHEIYCRWCGDGGDLVYCDNCPCSFCVPCIARNFGLEEASRVMSLPTWTCFVCAPEALQPVKVKTSIECNTIISPPLPDRSLYSHSFTHGEGRLQKHLPR